MKLPCPGGECGTTRCPIENLSASEQAIAVALAEETFSGFTFNEVKGMSREERELLLTRTERSKDESIPETDRIQSAQAYSLIATAVHRYAQMACHPTT